MNWLKIATRMSCDLSMTSPSIKKIVLVHKNLMRAGLRNNEFYLCGLSVLWPIILFEVCFEKTRGVLQK